MEREIEILSKGQKVELNPFSESIVLNTIVALLQSLKGIDLAGEVRIVVRPKARR